MFKKVLILTAAVFTAASVYASAESYPVAELMKNPDVNGVEIPQVSDFLDIDEYIPTLFVTAQNPSATAVEKAMLSGEVENGKISADGGHVGYDNGETASVYTLTINPGDYTIDGFCVSCTAGDESMIKDFRLPAITGGDVEVNLVVNRPDAVIKLGTLKTNGKDAFNGNGIPYAFEIVEGEASDWRVSSDGHTIEEYIGDEVDTLVIPNMIDGKIILSVQNETLLDEGKVGTLFGEYNEKTGIDVPAKTVEISDGIQILGSFLFYRCSDLSGDIDIPYTVRAIGPYAFAGCEGLSGDVDLSYCSALYPYSFAGCKNLKGTLTLPAVASIPSGIFVDCPLSGVLEIPEGVTSIGDYAFAMNNSGKDGINAVALPSTLKVIGAVAFQHRDASTDELVLPAGLLYIGDFAFNHCTGFSNTKVEIPSTVKVIGGDLAIAKGEGTKNTGYGGHVLYDSFYNNEEFVVNGNGAFCAIDGVLMSRDGTRIVTYPMAKVDESYVIPEGVTQIDEMAFGRTKVKTVTLPDSFVFSTTVPENIINKEGNNFAVAMYIYNNCREVLTKETNPSYKSIDGTVYSKDGTELWYVPTMHGEVTVADGCTTIKNGAFFCSGSPVYTKWGTVTIPASVTEIEENSLVYLNKSRATIIVDEDNPVYTVTNGKIAKKIRGC